MKSKNVFIGLILVAAIGFFAQSCSKDEEGTIPETDIVLAQDEAYVEAIFDEVDNLALAETKTLDDNDYVNPGLKSTFTDICYTVTVDHPDSTTFPKVVTIDFGDGCSIVFNGDTITRSGQIIITLTNRWFIPGAQHIMTFNNFYFNGAKVEGTRTVTYTGLNQRNRFEVDVELEYGKVSFGDAFVTRTASHVREWAWHLNPLIDTVYVTGNASGVNTLGENYSRDIVEPLVYVRCSNLNYHWGLAGGKVEITNSTRGNMTIEHSGNGCSGEVIVEKDGNQYNYQFRYRYYKRVNN